MREHTIQLLFGGAWRAPALGFLAVGAVLIITFLLMYGSVAQLRGNDRWVAHSYEVLRDLAATLSSARDAEAAQRGYLLTQEPAYLASVAPAVEAAMSHTATLVTLTSDNAMQNRRARLLREKLRARLDVLESNVVLGRQGRIDAARERIAGGMGRGLMGEVEATARALENEERRLLALRAAQSERSAEIVLIAFATTGIINLALLAGVARIVANEWRRDRKAAEEIKRLNADLERRVNERTAELSEANDELQAFAHSVAHDLRAPLRNMQGFAVALVEDYGDKLDESGKHYTARIIAGAARLDGLIQDLLAYSRLTRSQIELTRIDLTGFIERTLKEMEDEVSRRHAQVEIRRPLPAVMAHAPTLGQIVTHLISNAMKFVAAGTTPQVLVSAMSLPNGRVQLSVRDNGIGIEPRHQERIFRVFERLHGHDAYPGTGIGLAIVRKGAERMNGRVGVTSQPGTGSKFWVELAAAQA